ncbi:hypothetical protein LSM04_006676 [Trypanosoma melophagium]|uniref:uncharacterized protein n=1 Tax=Trypanosoma melophagium TaxID=715481 RepID=UPI00351A9175|nr:hypothetical protein LSM04_006676 [Trypanosoma melophagium]
MERENIYQDLELRRTVVSTPLIAVIVCVVTSILLLAVIAYILYRCYYKDKGKENSTYSRSVQPFHSDDSNTDDTNVWRRTFNKLVSDDPQRTLNSAVLHAILFVPLDLELPNPLENAELFSDEFCFNRAKERRCMLNDLFLAPDDRGSIRTSKEKTEASEPISKYYDPKKNSPLYPHTPMKFSSLANLGDSRTRELTQADGTRVKLVNDDGSENQLRQRLQQNCKQRTPRE